MALWCVPLARGRLADAELDLHWADVNSDGIELRGAAELEDGGAVGGFGKGSENELRVSALALSTAGTTKMGGGAQRRREKVPCWAPRTRT